MNFNLCAVKFVQHDDFFSFCLHLKITSDSMIKLNLTGERLLGGWHIHLCLFVEKKIERKLIAIKLMQFVIAAILHIEFTLDLTCARFFVIIIIFLQPFKTVTKFVKFDMNVMNWSHFIRLIVKFVLHLSKLFRQHKKDIIAIELQNQKKWKTNIVAIGNEFSIIWCSSFIDKNFVFCIRLRNISEKIHLSNEHQWNKCAIYPYILRSNSFFSQFCIVLNASSDFLSIQNSSQRNLIIICRCANNISAHICNWKFISHYRPKKKKMNKETEIWNQLKSGIQS